MTDLYGRLTHEADVKGQRKAFIMGAILVGGAPRSARKTGPCKPVVKLVPLTSALLIVRAPGGAGIWTAQHLWGEPCAFGRRASQPVGPFALPSRDQWLHTRSSRAQVYSLVTWFGGDEVDSGRTDFEHFLTSYFAILFACFGIAQAQVSALEQLVACADRCLARSRRIHVCTPRHAVPQVGFPDVGKAKDAVRSVFPILDRKSKIDASDPSGQLVDKLQGAVELRDVTFAYPSRASVMVFK